jgi:hypothetical protein
VKYLKCGAGEGSKDNMKNEEVLHRAKEEWDMLTLI